MSGTLGQGTTGRAMTGSGPGLRYWVASLCLGLIAVWGSENFFWTAPAEPWHPSEWLLTVAAYALVCAAALSAVLWTGVSGWQAAFLGGALLGFGVEGVVITTMYDAFPAQVIWTPLAWHALITGGVVLGLSRALVRRHWAVHCAALVAVGLCGALWGLYWRTERTEMPGYEVTLPYLVGLGVTVVLAQIALDRLGDLVPPRAWVLAIAPVVLAGLWVVRMMLSPAPVLLACPVMVATTVWIMWRLGRGGGVLRLGPAVPIWRHGLFLLVPLVTAALVVPGWAHFGPVAVNVPFGLFTGLTGTVIWLALFWRAAKGSRLSAP